MPLVIVALTGQRPPIGQLQIALCPFQPRRHCSPLLKSLPGKCSGSLCVDEKPSIQAPAPLGMPLISVTTTAVSTTHNPCSAGGSLHATVEYIIGTFGGAVYAAIIGLLIPHTTAIAQGGVLALTIAPLALAAALNPNFRVAPFSAVLVLLISGQLSEGPSSWRFIVWPRSPSAA